MKKCIDCGEIKPVSEFYQDKKRGFIKPPCKSCDHARRRKWAAANREKTIAQAKRHYRRQVETYGLEALRERHAAWRDVHPADPLNRLRIFRKWKYGLTVEQTLRILEEQDNRCAICRVEITELKCEVDHHNDTQEVRGLLCAACNVGLGCFHDNPEAHLAAIHYLQAAIDKYGPKLARVSGSKKGATHGSGYPQ